MSQPLIERIPFAKMITLLAIIFGVSLGTCGMTALVSSRMPNGAALFVFLAILELIAALLSAAGLVLTVIMWIVLSAVNSLSRKRSEPQQLFDDSNNGDKDKG